MAHTSLLLHTRHFFTTCAVPASLHAPHTHCASCCLLHAGSCLPLPTCAPQPPPSDVAALPHSSLTWVCFSLHPHWLSLWINSRELSLLYWTDMCLLVLTLAMDMPAKPPFYQAHAYRCLYSFAGNLPFFWFVVAIVGGLRCPFHMVPSAL